MFYVCLLASKGIDFTTEHIPGSLRKWSVSAPHAVCWILKNEEVERQEVGCGDGKEGFKYTKPIPIGPVAHQKWCSAVMAVVGGQILMFYNYVRTKPELFLCALLTWCNKAPGKHDRRLPFFGGRGL